MLFTDLRVGDVEFKTYCGADIEMTGSIYGKFNPPQHCSVSFEDIYLEFDRMFNNTKPIIKTVIFNNPATIILWKDGSKTVVKCQSGDQFDKEKGFVMAYLKKLLGNDNTFNKEINKWVEFDD